MPCPAIVASIACPSSQKLSAQVSNAGMRRKVETEGQPQAGVHVLMGELYLQSRINVLRGEEEGRVRTVEVVARKPS
jgi:hypothetical protein